MTGSIGWPRLAPPQHIDDCCVIHFLHWVLSDKLWSSHQNVPLWVRLYQHVLCKKPLSISSWSIFHSSDPSESAYLHCAYPNPVPLLLEARLEVHGKCLDFLALGFPKALLKYFHQPNSVWIPVANQATHGICLSVLLPTPFFIFVSSFCGFMQRVSLKLFIGTSTSFLNWIFGVSVDIKYGILWWRWWRSRWGCSWRRARWWTRNHQWYIVGKLQSILLPFLMRSGFWPLFHCYVSMILTEFPQGKNCGSFFKKHNFDE